MIADIARHVASGAAPVLGFTCLAEAGRTPAPSPIFVFGPASRDVNEEIYGQTQIGAVGTYVLDDAVVAPTGIAMKDGVAFSATAFIHPPHHVATVVGRLTKADLPVRRVAGTVAVIYGPGHETYGHWLVDFLPRLWVLAACGHNVTTLRFVVPPDLKPMAGRLLAEIGILDTQIEVYRYWKEVLHVDRLLMPTGLRTHNRVAPQFCAATAFWTDRLMRSAPAAAGTHTHLFVSRAGVASDRILRNRQQIEVIAAARGYKSVCPELLPIRQQAAMFAGARVIVGEYGSGLHGSVYAAPGTLTIGLRGTGRHPSFVQSGITHAQGQSAGYVLGDTVFGQAGGEAAQTFQVHAQDFERALDIAALVTAPPSAKANAP